MSEPSLADRWHLARLGLGRAAAVTRSRGVLGAFGPRRFRALADELVFVPSDLRPADPGVLDELRMGQLGLSGLVFDVGTGSPFAYTAADPHWQRELNGFVWLGGLRAAGGEHAVEIARRLVADWCRRHRQAGALPPAAHQPEVIARRVVAWIVNAGFLLEGAPRDFHHTFTRMLGAELRALDRETPKAPLGYPRLACLMALALASLSIVGHDRHRTRIERALTAELHRQVLADGGHVTRNYDVVLDILLDLMPVSQCYIARGLPVPERLASSIAAMLAGLRQACATSHALARFNGVGVPRADALATVLALEPTGRPPSSGIGSSGYARLERGVTTLIVDCGPPPPLEHAGRAHAGCLSFELAHANRAIVVNRGAPGPGHLSLLPDARATASHSTLTVGDASSGRLVRAPLLDRLGSGSAVSGPAHVEARFADVDGGLSLVASHDGYLARFGLVHSRSLALSADGLALTGSDRLGPPRGTLRLARDLPFEVHFHLPPEASAVGDTSGVTIAVAGGRPWHLSAEGCHVSIEAATDFAAVRGPVAARQVVLRAVCPGEARIDWRLILA
jgi:uncharacterized heparinase superfamily protein